MKKVLTRLFALILAAAMLLPLAACSIGGDKDTTVSPEPTQPTQTIDANKTDPETLTFSPFDLEGARIVFPETASDSLEKTAQKLAKLLAGKTGVSLPVGSDRVDFGTAAPADTKEILLGKTNRAESFDVLRANDYRIEKRGARLVIAGGSDAALDAAVEELFAQSFFFNGTTLLAPSAAYDYAVSYKAETLVLGGADIRNYTIVRDAANAECAEYLRNAIRNVVGHDIPVAPDYDGATPYEICIGNLEQAEDIYPEAGKYIIKQQGTKLILGGTGANAGYYALIDFINSYLSPDRTVGTLTISVAEKIEAHKQNRLFALNLAESLPDMTGKYGMEMSAENVFKRFLLAKEALPDEVTVVNPIKVEDYPFSQQRQVYVSPTGDDKNVGSFEEPFATIGRALTVISQDGAKGGIIWVRGGTYELSKTISLAGNVGGTPVSPLFIKAYVDENNKKEEVRLTTHKKWSKDLNIWQNVDPVTDAVAARLPEDVQSEVLYAKISDLGLTPADIGGIDPSNGPAKLYVGDVEYTTARYPNNTGNLQDLFFFTHVYEQGYVNSPSGTDLYYPWLESCANRGIDPSTKVPWEVRVINQKDNIDNVPSGKMKYWYHKEAQNMADEVTSWVNTGNIWCYGSTFEGWEFAYYNLEFLPDNATAGNWHYGENGEKLFCGFKNDQNGMTITTYDANGKATEKKGYYSLKSKTPNAPYGVKDSANSPAGHNTFYFFNAIEMLDQPGEWFYDSETEIIYLYPTPEFGMDGEEYEMTYAGTDSYHVFSASSASYVVLDGLNVQGCSARPVLAANCSSFILQNCKFKYAALGVSFSNGTNCAVLNCEFSRSLYSGMLTVASGVSSMEPTDNIVQNNIFYNPADLQQWAVSLSGVRNIVSHNYFSDVQVNGSGYENIIEYNHFSGGSKDVVDGGMIYYGGSSQRGNHFRYNLFHMFNANHNAVYNDTQACGSYTYGNIVSTIGGKASHHKGWYSSSGNGNVCYGNIMVLRNPLECTESQLSESDEGEAGYDKIKGAYGSLNSAGNFQQSKGDDINQSNLFYYYYSQNGYQTGSINKNPFHYYFGYNEWAQLKDLQARIVNLGGYDFISRYEYETLLLQKRIKEGIPGGSNPVLGLDAYRDLKEAGTITQEQQDILDLLEQLYNGINQAIGRGTYFTQSLAGHWWNSYAVSRVAYYHKRVNQDVYKTYDPLFYNYIYTVDMFNQAYNESDYMPWYFYKPQKLAYQTDFSQPDGLARDDNGALIRKTFTYVAPVGTLFTIPKYQYLDEEGKTVTVEQSTRTVQADPSRNDEMGSVTFTYEEIASMERLDRSASCCVIKDNIILGGTPVLDLTDVKNPKPDGTNRVVEKMVITNNTLGSAGYFDTVMQEGNFLYYTYDDIMEDVKEQLYEIKPEGWAIIEEWMSEYVKEKFNGDFAQYRAIFKNSEDQFRIGTTFLFDTNDYLTEKPLGAE